MAIRFARKARTYTATLQSLCALTGFKAKLWVPCHVVVAFEAVAGLHEHRWYTTACQPSTRALRGSYAETIGVTDGAQGILNDVYPTVL